MSDDEQAGGFGWLPAGLQRRMAAEDAAERQAERDAAAEREAVREQKHEAALALYRSQAEARGEVVSAVALATGQVTGRDVNEVLADARAAAEREDARQASRDRREDVHFIDQEPAVHTASRSSWPESEWELDRIIRQQQDDRSWIAGAALRRAAERGQAAEHIEAMRAEAGRNHGSDLRRDRATSSLSSWSEICR
jgi:hypothetical protein